MDRTGSALLPLHSGRVPEWLHTRRAQLGRVVVEAIVLHYGRDEVLRRLSHPFWFQAFGAVMGMDWHSSGITTSVLGALKKGLAPVEDELGLYVCGGKGAQSRRTPAELEALGLRWWTRCARSRFPTWGCPWATRCAPATCCCAASTARWPPRPSRGRRTSPELLLTPGVGARTVAALAHVAEVVHGAPYRFSDPARFSFAQGGKDRHPYPVKLKVYDDTLRVLRRAVDAAKLGNAEKLSSLRELDRQARRLEATATGPSFDELVQEGWAAVDGEPLLPTCAPPRTAGKRPAAVQQELPGLERAPHRPPARKAGGQQ
ncbi:DUF763 domain-containing protein [Pyxidicoccus parkwayensis]|uniref:DUF763 domain-containing protein n=1 Tax=Pyxidicoccus parkwayensis TaxID=2813578 RepID=UPI001F511035|nr:DUF763 domain-containing protein [Pyxidicoccus parkwaysis]